MESSELLSGDKKDYSLKLTSAIAHTIALGVGLEVNTLASSLAHQPQIQSFKILEDQDGGTCHRVHLSQCGNRHG